MPPPPSAVSPSSVSHRPPKAERRPHECAPAVVSGKLWWRNGEKCFEKNGKIPRLLFFSPSFWFKSFPFASIYRALWASTFRNPRSLRVTTLGTSPPLAFGFFRRWHVRFTIPGDFRRLSSLANPGIAGACYKNNNFWKHVFIAQSYGHLEKVWKYRSWDPKSSPAAPLLEEHGANPAQQFYLLHKGFPKPLLHRPSVQRPS